jgi:flavin-dependent dehydrogenase
VAQEAEFLVTPEDDGALTVSHEMPSLYFCPDLKGYGWCFRKQNYMNIGFGRLDRRSLPQAVREFVDFLAVSRAIPRHNGWRWRGHAYWVHPSPRTRRTDDGLLLIGDAAGLAYPQSGEGIRPAIESGLLAAQTIADADGDYSNERLRAYNDGIRARFDDQSSLFALASRVIPARVAAVAAGRLLRSPTFVRHVVLDRWFLHANQPALSVS